MLRPATWLSALLFAAFVLLLISVISTPIVKGIKLATYKEVDFGVFGFCTRTGCSGMRIGYKADNAFTADEDFSLPPSARNSLSYLLIVHPVAAVFTLVLLVLAAAAHLHSPSHSPRYLLALLILTLPTLLLSLLAFLVDILLFVPHMKEGGWLVLVATLLLGASSIFTCAMRRTLVGRKARQKRIAENAEMSGENYYNQQAASSPPPLSKEPTAPIVNGAPGADKLPSFATFEKENGPVPTEDRVPLNPRRPSNSTRDGASAVGVAVGDDGLERYGTPRRMGPSPGPLGRGYGGARDEFGNPLPPSAAFGPSPSPGHGIRRDPSDPRLRDQYGPMQGPHGGGPMPYGGRGRGGYPPNGRGGYGRGGPPGGFRGPSPHRMNSDGRGMAPGNPGMMMAGGSGRGGQRGPPPGYNNGYDGGAFGNGPYAREPSPYGGGYGRRPSPGPPSAPAYGRRPSPGPPSDPRAYDAYNAGEPPPQMPYGAVGAMRRTSTPPPPMPPAQNGSEMVVGQAVEMDATTGSPSPSQTPNMFNGLRDSDGDVRGMVGLQQNRQGSPLRHPSSAMSATSVYSQEQFVPARAAWNDGGRTGTPPLNTIQEPAEPVELPTANDMQGTSPVATRARMGSGDNYYEDVDPRFAETEPVPHRPEQLPASLTPGYGDALHHTHAPAQQHLHPNVDHRQSYEELHGMARSPAESDTSAYTSVSQRGVNPNWRPGPGQQPRQDGMMPPRRPVGGQPPRDPLLAGNNDFELPGGGPGRGGRGPPQFGGASGGGNGRYPHPNEI